MIESDESMHNRKVIKEGLIKRISKEESLPYTAQCTNTWHGKVINPVKRHD